VASAGIWIGRRVEERGFEVAMTLTGEYSFAMNVETDVVVEQFGAVLVVRINRPEVRNAMNREVMKGIGAGMRSADEDPAVRAVVLTGTGDRAFCAGMDLRAFSDGSLHSEGNEGDMDAFRDFMSGNFSTPVIGAANATAVAGGLELLLACDLIVASDEAKFAIPEVKRGLFAAGEGVFLPQRIPLAIALEMGMIGDSIDAQRACEIGLINRTVPAGKVLEEALELANQVAANGPLGVQATRQLMRAAVRVPEPILELREQLHTSVFGSDDAKEGSLAFIEKREPQWTGR
jgi:enoyl-CoA hydratase